MSFSYYKTGVADEVRADIKASSAIPATLKEFLLLAIHGLKEHHGADVKVDIECRGHLCGGKDAFPEESSIAVMVRRKSIASVIGDAKDRVEEKIREVVSGDNKPDTGIDATAEPAAS